MGARPSTKRSAPARRYESPLRDRRSAETRASLIAAASQLFVAKGWAGTGMRDIAAAAGVATETVYAHFSSKRGLLQAVLDVAVVGDDRSVALASRDEFAAVGQGRRLDRIRAAVRLLAGIQERTAALFKVLREAAAGDEAIAEILSAARERQRRDIAAGAQLMMGRAPTPVERDGFWALASPEVYLLLVEETGWTRRQYEEWMAELIGRTIPRH